MNTLRTLVLIGLFLGLNRGILVPARGQETKPPPEPSQSEAPKPVVITFDSMESGKAPADFVTAQTGEGAKGVWQVIEDPTAPTKGKVLAQTDTDDTDGRYPMCVYEKVSAKDVHVSVRFKTISGEVDQAAGIVARFKDGDNYYITRANALEDNVRLYRVGGGKRKQFAGINLKVTPNEWHTLALEIKGAHFNVSMDDKLLFEADDETFKEPGKTGLWTKADSVTHFDDLKILSLDAP